MATKRILIIDDEIGFTQLVKINLEGTGRFKVGIVNNPLEALAFAQTFKPHLILLDVMLPRQTGGELLVELEADPQLKNVPVLFLTATTLSQLARAQHAAGKSRPIIAKPVAPQELIRRINASLGISLFGWRLTWGRAK